MRLSIKNPAFSLNKAYRKVKPQRDDFEKFKMNLQRLLEHAGEDKFEDFNKGVATDFLKDTFYSPDYYINIKERNDSVIHLDNSPNSLVGVIIEAKSLKNKSEMITRENANVKSLHELMLYFLRERITQKNKELKHLIATNCHEWFLFDAQQFEKIFAQSKKLVKQFEDFEAGRLSGTTTDFFYKEIAKPFIAALQKPLECTWFDISAYQKLLNTIDTKSERKLIALYKIFSPEHMLKLPFANDSNSLDQNFYKELLHIIGLEETKVKGKKLIGRKDKETRNPGSLLENTIDHILSKDKLSRVSNLNSFGENREDRLFGIALELCITWMNRILFLKLLEAQLISYQKGVKTTGFLNTKRIKDFDVLDDLFFDVLAKKYEERNTRILNDFGDIPYLNSSLFDPTELEHEALFISNLRDDMTLPIHASTVLKGEGGKRRKGEMSTIAYLFEFLDAYDFTSEGSEDIQEESKTLINASVLGLIFEKINGYKDGSFFTPGFITMYMCRETIRRAVVQKFNEAKGWKCESFEDLDDKLELIDRNEANEIINSLKICDPAVGSGHFLVSALNEILAIKHELRILQDRDGKRLREYHLEVVNDELIVYDSDGDLFEYHPNSPESQRVQEALFHEKQTIIENCLFGVDINPNSVKICRLRLWIELLKHAYYKTADSNEVIPRRRPGSGAPSEHQTPDQVRGDDGNKNGEGRHLETLPNIDINIKTGNSLISRFALDADLKEALKKSKWSIESYRVAVQSYRNARSKDEKREMLRLMDDIKGNFRTEILRTDKNVVKLKKLSDELVVHTTQTSMFDQTAKEKKVWKTKTEKLTKDIAKLEAEIEEIKNNKIYENAFEWRFEFPEVLNEQGDFVGFDVVIGNPPYIRQEEFKEIKPYIQDHYTTYSGTADMYVYFVERGFQNLKENGQFTYIIPNKWMRAGYGKHLRNYLKERRLKSIIDFGDLPVFEEATTYPCILEIEKAAPDEQFKALNVESLEFPEGLDRFAVQHKIDVLSGELPEQGWTLTSAKEQRLLAKLKSKGTPLGEYVDGKIYYGIKTGYNKAFVIDEETKKRLITEDPNCAEIIKPFLAGRDIKRYQQPVANNYLILFKNGYTKTWFGELDEKNAWDKLSEKYPSITKHLFQFKEQAKKRSDQGEFWWELRACAYYKEFENSKIIFPDMSLRGDFTLDYSDDFFFANTGYMVVTNEFSLLAILASKLIEFFNRSTSTSFRGGYLRFYTQYLEINPIIELTGNEKTTFESKVTEILSLKKENPQADTSKLEAEIDQMVYDLYGLTEEEIAIVEESVG